MSHIRTDYGLNVDHIMYNIHGNTFICQTSNGTKFQFQCLTVALSHQHATETSKRATGQIYQAHFNSANYQIALPVGPYIHFQISFYVHLVKYVTNIMANSIVPTDKIVLSICRTTNFDVLFI